MILSQTQIHVGRGIDFPAMIDSQHLLNNNNTVKSDEENEKILGETWETQKLRTIVRACTVQKLLRTYSTNKNYNCTDVQATTTQQA